MADLNAKITNDKIKKLDNIIEIGMIKAEINYDYAEHKN